MDFHPRFSAKDIERFRNRLFEEIQRSAESAYESISEGMEQYARLHPEAKKYPFESLIEPLLQSPVIRYLMDVGFTQIPFNYSSTQASSSANIPYLRSHVLGWQRVVHSALGRAGDFTVAGSDFLSYSVSKQPYGQAAGGIDIVRDPTQLANRLPHMVFQAMRGIPAFAYTTKSLEDIKDFSDTVADLISMRVEDALESQQIGAGSPPSVLRQIEERYPLFRILARAEAPLASREFWRSGLFSLGHEAGHGLTQQLTYVSYGRLESLFSRSRSVESVLGDIVAQATQHQLLGEAYADIFGAAIALSKREIVRDRYGMEFFTRATGFSLGLDDPMEVLNHRYGDPISMTVIDPKLLEQKDSMLYRMIAYDAIGDPEANPSILLEKVLNMQQMDPESRKARFPELSRSIVGGVIDRIQNLHLEIGEETSDPTFRMIRDISRTYGSRLWTISYILGKWNPSLIGRTLRISEDRLEVEDPETGTYKPIAWEDIQLPHVGILADKEDLIHPEWAENANAAVQRINRVIDWLNRGNEWKEPETTSWERYIHQWERAFRGILGESPGKASGNASGNRRPLGPSQQDDTEWRRLFVTGPTGSRDRASQVIEDWRDRFHGSIEPPPPPPNPGTSAQFALRSRSGATRQLVYVRRDVVPNQGLLWTLQRTKIQAVQKVLAARVAAKRVFGNIFGGRGRDVIESAGEEALP